MQTKFKTGINAFYLSAVIIFNIIVLLLLTSKIFVTTNIGMYFGILLLIIDVLFIIPMMFKTGYEFKENYLLVKDWPVKKYKIPYESIFSIEDGDFETKHKKIVALSTNRIAIGYKVKSVNPKDKKDVTQEKSYIFISPSEMSLFLIRLNGRLKESEAEMKIKAKKLSEQQKEHENKKKQWQKEKAEKKAQKQPEIIEANNINKFSSFTEPDSEENKK